jgi:Na+/proline symporter
MTQSSPPKLDYRTRETSRSGPTSSSIIGWIASIFCLMVAAFFSFAALVHHTKSTTVKGTAARADARQAAIQFAACAALAAVPSLCFIALGRRHAREQDD